MPFPKLLLAYLLTAAAFFAIDLVWLGVIAKNLYQKQIGHLMASQVNWAAAITFYLIFIAGILLFAVFPAVEKASAIRALWLGGALGFLAYATYDLTNLATLKDWPFQIVVIDLLWGTVLTGVVSLIGFYIVNWIN